MDGPLAYLEEHREEVLEALQTRDLTPGLHVGDARDLSHLDDASVHLVVTSPPYPMIEMWDEQFQELTGLTSDDPGFYEASHGVLDDVWAECQRVLAPGGILCVNVGDATRTVDGSFQLFPNHVRIAQALDALELTPLIPILWRKPTNKPNAFLGSGFLPPNGYVTLDCEFVLIYRKGDLRSFPPHDPLRYASQFSKQERDAWFTQVWDVRGERQEGMATFPEEVPMRLVRMYSCLGDTVLDPFAGTGTTVKVARRWGRRALGVEVDPSLEAVVRKRVPTAAPRAETVLERVEEAYR